MVSDRHPDQAIYLDPEPSGHKVWTKWVPHIVVEVVSPGGEQRDFVYPGKKDHHKRVTTENTEEHGKGKLTRIFLSVYFSGFRG